LPEDFSDDAFIAALLIEVDVSSVRVFFAPPTDFSFDALQVLRGSSQSEFVIVLVGHRLGNRMEALCRHCYRLPGYG